MTGQEPHTNYHRGVGTARTALTTTGFSTSGRSAGNPTPLPPPSTWAWGTAPGTPGGAKLCLESPRWQVHGPSWPGTETRESRPGVSHPLCRTRLYCMHYTAPLGNSGDKRALRFSLKCATQKQIK